MVGVNKIIFIGILTISFMFNFIACSDGEETIHKGPDYKKTTVQRIENEEKWEVLLTYADKIGKTAGEYSEVYAEWKFNMGNGNINTESFEDLSTGAIYGFQWDGLDDWTVSEDQICFIVSGELPVFLPEFQFSPDDTRKEVKEKLEDYLDIDLTYDTDSGDYHAYLKEGRNEFCMSIYLIEEPNVEFSGIYLEKDLELPKIEYDHPMV